MFADDLARDFPYGLRQLARHPGFATAAILTLALGIGSTSIVYAVADALWFRPPPYQDADRLFTPTHESARVQWDRAAEFLDAWRAQAVFAGVEARQSASMTAIDETSAFVAAGELVTPGLFPLLGVPPRFGRVFSPDEGRAPVVVISHALWVRRYGTRPDVLGRTLRLDGEPHVIVGVMPPRFLFPRVTTDLWVPFVPRPDDRGLTTVVRLRDGVSVEAGEGAVEALDLADADGRFELRPLHTVWGERRARLWVLLGAVGCLLLIACANTANLVMSRGVARRREFAVRAALGAGRHRLVGQILTEVAVLAVLGGAAGLWLTTGSLAVLPRWLPPELIGYGPGESPDATVATALLRPDWRLLATTVGITTLAALLAGLVPALRGAKGTVAGALRGGPGGAAEIRLKGALIAAETAVAVLLVVGAGLLVTSFARLVSIDLGFQAEEVVAVRPEFRGGRYETAEQRFAFLDELLRRADAQPSLGTLAVSDGLPMHTHGVGLLRVGQAEQGLPEDPIVVQELNVSGTYFDALGISLVDGRTFTAADRRASSDVAIIGDRLARRVWPEVSPVGRQLRIGNALVTVVGVVCSVVHLGYFPLLNGITEPADVYRPLPQAGPGAYGYLVARGSRPRLLARQLTQLVSSADPALASHVFYLGDDVVNTAGQPRFMAWLMASFAALALLLAAMGVSGVVAFEVGQRRREIGIRGALGATQAQAVRLVMTRGTVMVGVGLAIGVAVSLALSRYLESLLFAVSPTEPSTFASAVAVMAISAALAGYLPARRAARVDPMGALRSE